jgi:uncharacterized membrane protein
MLNKKFLIIIVLFIIGCKTNNNIYYYYQDRSKATESDIEMEKYYYENIPKESLRKDDEILLVFNAEAFKNENMVLNETEILLIFYHERMKSALA